MTGILNISRWHMQWPSPVEKMDMHKFYSRQIYRKIVTKLRSKCEANAKFVSLFTTPCFSMSIWNLPSLLHIYSSVFIFCLFLFLFLLFFFLAKYSVQGENLCNKLGWARTTPTLVPLISLILIFWRASPSLLYGSPSPPGKISPLENFVHAHNR